LPLAMASRPQAGRAAFGALLSRTYRQWRRAADLKLQPYGLTEATWLPLIRMARAPKPPRQKGRAAALVVDNSSVLRLLANLETAGQVERKEGEGRRAKVILLTQRGRAIADKVEAAARRVRTDALAGLTDRDIETAIRVLEHVCRALEPEKEPA